MKRDSAVDEAPKRVVEEVVDLSLPRPAAPVPVVSAASAVGMKSSKKREKRKEAGEDDDMFADSRGTGPSERFPPSASSMSSIDTVLILSRTKD